MSQQGVLLYISTLEPPESVEFVGEFSEVLEFSKSFSIIEK